MNRSIKLKSQFNVYGLLSYFAFIKTRMLTHFYGDCMLKNMVIRGGDRTTSFRPSSEAAWDPCSASSSPDCNLPASRDRSYQRCDDDEGRSYRRCDNRLPGNRAWGSRGELSERALLPSVEKRRDCKWNENCWNIINKIMYFKETHGSCMDNEL